jgi:5-methylcytosine-specific restriction endonuclease McrA
MSENRKYIILTICIFFITSACYAKSYHYHAPKISSPKTYIPKSYTPKYKTYPTTSTSPYGGTTTKRSYTQKHEFLKSHGYDKTPPGYEVDHITPLKDGGADSPYNMQLLPQSVHHQKTAMENKMRR